MSHGRLVEFFHVCPCGCGDIIPISQRDHSWISNRDYSRLPCLPLWRHVLTKDWRPVVRAVVVAVDVPRPTATPARVVRLGLSVDGDQGAPNHPGPHNRPGVVLSVNPSTQAAGAP